METIGHLQVSADATEPRQTTTCPQLRPAQADWLYPVEGYCVLGHWPGYMIPSIAEYRERCTTARFVECPQFRSRGPAREEPSCAVPLAA